MYKAYHACSVFIEVHSSFTAVTGQCFTTLADDSDEINCRPVAFCIDHSIDYGTILACALPQLSRTLQRQAG
jgi:hypothetical protein